VTVALVSVCTTRAGCAARSRSPPSSRPA
jgi:hypothetical protein